MKNGTKHHKQKYYDRRERGNAVDLHNSSNLITQQTTRNTRLADSHCRSQITF